MQHTLSIEQLFYKDIHREINGVIQAGQSDLSTIQNELEEYVMTQEGTENLTLFYSNYMRTFKQQTTNMGVWISGFFGSGKSHFLKILSYLLDNKEIGEKKPFEYFHGKTENASLLEQMKECASKPSDAILFNIDSKSSTTSSEKEKIVEVFLRVFNTQLGFSDTLWIADIERQIADDGKYERLKEEALTVSGIPWEELRLKIKLKRKAIVTALINIGYDEETAKELLNSAAKTFDMSSEKFAKMVGDYCKSRGNDYSLIFLVDEVGQYVGQNSSLMLNLQTVVEDLGNYANGQAWVIVTSQEKIEAVTKLHSNNDFSKIQGRFATKINLSSSNTDEVIKKRLLQKRDVAVKTLGIQYDVQEQMIRNRLSFKPNTTLLRSAYRSRDEFVSLYPFVPYQVELLQKVFNKIRTQGEGGAHLAHGERSLLKAFQAVVCSLANEGATNLATFAQFYEPIKGFLETPIKSTIAKAEDRARNHEDIEWFDVDVLKTLYMVKSIDDIQTVAENVAVLLIDAIDCERAPLELKVKESLQRLQRANLIEQHADQTYSFLSDEEQEINREIRNEDINPSIVTERLGKFFFEKFVPAKYTYQNIYPFDFNKRFDGYIKGNMASDLTLQVYTGGISPQSMMLEANEGRLIMCLDEESTAIAEQAQKYAEQVNSYVRRKRGGNTTETQNKILDTKQEQVVEFEKQAKEKLEEACKHAVFYIQGQERTFSGDIQTQMSNAFEMLVRNTYSKIGYIEKSIPLKDVKKEIVKIAEQGTASLLDGNQNKNAYDEVWRYLEDKTNYDEKVFVKHVMEHFSKIPFGWMEHDIATLLADLQHDKKIKLLYNGGILEATNHKFVDCLLKTTERDRVRIEVQVEMPAYIRKEISALLREFFGQTTVGETYDDVANLVREQMNKKFIEPIRQMKERRQRIKDATYTYPGGIQLQKLETSIQNFMATRSSEEIVKQFIELEEDVEGWMNDVEGLQSFYLKTPIQHFDDAISFLKDHEADLIWAGADSTVQNVKQQVTSILMNSNPYRDIPRLPQLINELRTKLDERAEAERTTIIEQFAVIQADLVQLVSVYQGNQEITTVIQTGQEALQNELDVHVKPTNSVSKLHAYLQVAQQRRQALHGKVGSIVRRQQEEKKGNDETSKDETFQPNLIREKNVHELTGEELMTFFAGSEATITNEYELKMALQRVERKIITILHDATIQLKR
ncbi:BREX system P-loop protein BrxC [Aneurinibacillus sp. Ricciae_BoGa-3]|uniref:BREX system P-loop protein BrxC n=1 Tax=Aneurinibacillus sp. Ricciae_BoGa-3 TaxID=3022697 RepID=UPI002341303B|nr:BREX system P-loop protein BrxC [Aneurinibacillus sp. Ricciae_BoGa-3]WCK54749.1 BREX system P-loop protein BrxC [Aneurinibacillus sp. Ricciae_BoGa-3]